MPMVSYEVRPIDSELPPGDRAGRTPTLQLEANDAATANDAAKASGRKLLRRKSTWGRAVYAAQHVSLAVDFSPKAFRAVWVAMLVVRVWCIIFLVWSAQLYWFIAHPYMGYYASLIGPSAVANFKPMGVCFVLLAGLHARQVYKMLYYSLHFESLVLGPPPFSLGPDGDSLCFGDWRSRFRSPQMFLTTTKRDVSRLFFDRHGPFGVESSLFDLRFLVNELLEILSQTTQVYNASVLVSKAWMNNLYVTVTVLNSWSTPMLCLLFQNASPDVDAAARERFLCLAIDFVLDSATAMAIPMLIFVPYYQKFDFAAFNFELVYLYDDIWFANMVMENQQIVARDPWDFLWKMVPHLSIYGSLNSLRALIRPPRRAARVYCAPSRPSPPPAPPVQPPGQMPSVEPTATSEQPESAFQPSLLLVGDEGGGDDDDDDDDGGSDHDKAPPALPPHLIKPPPLVVSFPPIPEEEPLARPWVDAVSRDLAFLDDTSGPPSHAQGPRRHMLQNAMKTVLFLWGFAILVLHVRAAWDAHKTDVLSCTTRTRPWFATKVSCSVVRHNCHMHNASSVTNDDFAAIESSSVAALVFSHCPVMRVPTAVAGFHNLLGIDFYNCTLYEWSAEAAITAHWHPRLTYIILIHVNMTELPEGVLQPLPPSLTDFEISMSNLTELPLDLHEKWHAMSLFYVEFTQITAFPPTLQHLRVDDLSLIGNRIETLPEFAPHVAFVSLAMTHTPLIELPQSIGDTTGIGFLNLGYTNLSSFPPWMDSVATTATKIFVHHTPLCASKSEQEIADTYGEHAVLSCFDNDERETGKYPLAILAKNRLYDDPAMESTSTTTTTAES